MEDIRAKFAASLDLKGLRVVNFPSLIFFCGGPIPDGDAPFDVGSPFKSARHAIGHALKTKHPDIFKKIVLAETINDWFRGGLYQDLLEFEQDLAGLASVIALFVESSGSIAELGVFSRMPAISAKLLVFVRLKHYNDQSFIKLGPITNLENNSKSSVNVYDWAVNNEGNVEFIDDRAIDSVTEDIVEDILRRLDLTPTEQRFDTEAPGHIILFMCDIIGIVGVAKIIDIQMIFKICGLNVEDKDIKKYLFILERLNLINRYPYGNDRYLASQADPPFISYAFQSATEVQDRLRWQIMFREWIKETDQRRIRAERHEAERLAGT